ncbi:MAG: ABC transporter permease [Eubacterium sp.]|nr:ABC transporter permease [Eubacterium sp.]
MKTEQRYRGRISQTGIYFGKLIRMFIYQSDWKMLVMAALIAGLVTIAVGRNLFVTQEGTMTGCFALVCVCLWNGFFNSIQVVCRERDIIKREHRSGMHISSYIAAHMVYQLLLCVVQTIILLAICYLADIHFPKGGLVTGSFLIDAFLSLLLVTYAADVSAIAISSLVHNTTTAMTVMPFMLIFQLVFSGQFFQLEGALARLKTITIINWGQKCLCALGNYNGLPMATAWSMLYRFREVEVQGQKPMQLLLAYLSENNLKEQVMQVAGQYNTNPAFVYTRENILQSWGALLLITLIFAVIAVILLKLIDRDKR